MSVPLKILNLGAGVQSTTVLRMSISGELPKLDHAIFADTGWEPKEVYKHLEKLKKECKKAKIQFHVVTCGRSIYDDAFNSYGTVKSIKQHYASMPLFVKRIWEPTAENIKELESSSTSKNSFDLDNIVQEDFDKQKSDILKSLRLGIAVEQKGKIRRQCTSEYKIVPIERFIKKELLGRKGSEKLPTSCVVQNWFGISMDEMQRIRSPDKPWKSFYYPLIGLENFVGKQNWLDRSIAKTRQDCIAWHKQRKLLVPPRSACIGCPFHTNVEWLHMKENSPKEFEQACKVDDSIRNNIQNGQVFLHRSCIPLRDVIFEKEVKYKEFSLLDECTGMCGV